MCVNVFQIECEFYGSKDSILQKNELQYRFYAFLCVLCLNK